MPFSNFNLCYFPDTPVNTKLLQRRFRLSHLIREQIFVINADYTGDNDFVMRSKRVLDKETGQHVVKEYQTSIKRWWWPGLEESGDEYRCYIALWWGRYKIELSDGNNAVGTNCYDDLIPILEQLDKAVMAGHLDEGIEKASQQYSRKRLPQD